MWGCEYASNDIIRLVSVMPLHNPSKNDNN